MGRVAIIGCGNMGSALAQGMSKIAMSKIASLVLFDRHPEKSEALSKQLGGSAAKTLVVAVKGADFVVLAIKPKDLSAIAAEIAPLLGPKTILISLLAGISQEQLREKFPNSMVVRAMPNLAVNCGKGVTGLVEDLRLEQSIKQQLEALFEPTGTVIWVPENKIDALMALTACAPAFIAHIIEAFVEGGIYMGLSATQALPLVLQVFEGTLALLKDQDLHPAILRWQIASPGGTTIEGLKVLEEHRVHYAIMQALDASMQKSKKMSG